MRFNVLLFFTCLFVRHLGKVFNAHGLDYLTGHVVRMFKSTHNLYIHANFAQSDHYSNTR